MKLKQILSIFLSLAIITHGAPVNLSKRRFANETSPQAVAVFQEIKNATQGTDKEAEGADLSVKAIEALFVDAPACDQQDRADDIIDLGRSLGGETEKKLTQVAITYRQLERNTPNGQASELCTKSPKNQELNGLLQAQDLTGAEQTITPNEPDPDDPDTTQTITPNAGDPYSTQTITPNEPDPDDPDTTQTITPNEPDPDDPDVTQTITPNEPDPDDPDATQTITPNEPDPDDPDTAQKITPNEPDPDDPDQNATSAKSQQGSGNGKDLPNDPDEDSESNDGDSSIKSKIPQDFA